MPAAAVPALAGLHLAVALFGFAGLFGKWLTLPPLGIVLGRTVVAAIALAVVALAARTRSRPTAGLAANGVVLAVHWAAFFAAIQVASVAVGLLGYATFPAFVLVLERVLLGRRWHAFELATVALVCAGLVVLVPTLSWEDRTVRGLAWGILSGFTFALLAVRSRAHAVTHRPAEVALWQNAFAALALLPFAWAARTTLPPLTGRDLALLLVLGLVCTALAHSLFINSLRRVSAHTASVVAALEPVYGIALAAALLDEVPAPRTLVGAALILGAAFVATRRAA